ncbi:DUF2304 domain-containing protein [Candidatus Uhrbacteria bacterium]|nr:DUF2304 domain-containing protein [Candidatus Uhrbacteria bacterium]
MPIQILLSFIVAFIIAKAIASYRKRQVRFATFFFWSFFWIILIGVIWQPELANRLADFLRVGRGVDAVIYFSLILLFYLVFKIFVRMEMIDRQMTDLARSAAIENAKEHPTV